MTYITLEEAKDHIRVDYQDDDHYIESLVDVAETSIINEVAGRVPGLGTVTTVGTTALTGSGTNFLDFKAGDVIRVTDETDRTIASITTNEALTVTVAFTNTAASLSWSITPSPLVSGELPKPLKQAMLLLVGHLYNQRESVIVGSPAVKVPDTIDMLIAPYKNWVCK
jgi:hypothetical protein